MLSVLTGWVEWNQAIYDGIILYVCEASVSFHKNSLTIESSEFQLLWMKIRLVSTCIRKEQ